MGGVIPQAVKQAREAEQAHINATTPPSPEQQASEARRRDLLDRDRGIFGTIQTSFRGLLGMATQNKIRKTLLGE
jgi:hypothetical protein